jgi:hypothetical protein
LQRKRAPIAGERVIEIALLEFDSSHQIDDVVVIRVERNACAAAAAASGVFFWSRRMVP